MALDQIDLRRISHDYAEPLFEREKIVTLNLMEIEQPL
jgi:hypothetical protein